MRPKYHFAAAANWLSDPNGLVHHDGEWHLFYQYNPFGEDWGHMSWGHAVSTDLVQWQELPVAIAEDAGHMIFSGSAVVDRTGLAGFGSDALVAVYTAAAAQGPTRQSQALAYSQDRGRSWIKYPGNPVIDRGMADFRDPNVFWHGPTGRWIMVVALSEENRALIYASSDLKQWEELSVIDGADAPGQVWECPLLIELPVEGTSATRWLFKIDVLQGAPGSGAIYQTGTFDGTCFCPDGPDWQVADYGSDFYAAIAWHEPRDAACRPVWIGWMGNHAYQGRLPKQGWRGAMSLPRRLSLRHHGERYFLRQTVEAAAVAQVHTVSLGASRIAQAARLDLPGDRDFTLTLGDADGRSLLVERQGPVLLVGRRDPVSPFLDATKSCRTSMTGPITLWLDHGSLEIVADAGENCITMQHRMVGADLTMRYSA